MGNFVSVVAGVWSGQDLEDFLSEGQNVIDRDAVTPMGLVEVEDKSAAQNNKNERFVEGQLQIM